MGCTGVPPRPATVHTAATQHAQRQNPASAICRAHVHARFHCRHSSPRSRRRSDPSNSSNTPLALSELEVMYPTPQQRVEILDDIPQRPPTPSAQQFTDSLASAVARSACATRRRTVALRGNAEPEELPFPRPRHRALRAVDSQVQDILEEDPDSRASPARPPRDCPRKCCSHRHSDRTRARVAQAPCPDRSAGCWTTAATAARLAASFRARFDHAVAHQPGFQEPTDQLQHPCIARPRRATRAISTSWLTRSKNFSRSTSTTQRFPSRMYACALRTACCAPRPGRKP